MATNGIVELGDLGAQYASGEIASVAELGREIANKNTSVEERPDVAQAPAIPDNPDSSIMDSGNEGPQKYVVQTTDESGDQSGQLASYGKVGTVFDNKVELTMDAETATGVKKLPYVVSVRRSSQAVALGYSPASTDGSGSNASTNTIQTTSTVSGTGMDSTASMGVSPVVLAGIALVAVVIMR